MKKALLIALLLLIPGSLYASSKFIRAERAIKNSYIVVLRDDAPALAAAAEHLTSNAKGILRTTYGGLGKAFWAEMSESEAVRLAEHPWVDWVEEDAVVELAATQTNLGPLNLSPAHRHGGTYSSLWHLDRIDQATPSAARFDGSYHYCSTGSGVRVYVVDTGVLPTHKEFRTDGISRVDPATDLTTFLSGANVNLGSQCWTRSPSADAHSAGSAHGTAVASIIAGNTFGVAKGATIVDARAVECGGGNWSNIATVIKVLEWIPQDPNRGTAAQVVNLSLTFLNGGSWEPSYLRDTIRTLTDTHNVKVIAAAGNFNDNTIWYVPANSDKAITVAGTAQFSGGNFDMRWAHSNWGSHVDFFAPAQYIEAAHTITTEVYPNNPGVPRDVVRSEADDCESYPYDTCTSGTSFSAAVMSGVVARYLQNNRYATTSQVVAFLQTESATSSGVQIQDPGTGAYIPLLNLSDYSGQGVCQ